MKDKMKLDQAVLKESLSGTWIRFNLKVSQEVITYVLNRVMVELKWKNKWIRLYNFRLLLSKDIVLTLARNFAFI